MAKKIRVGVLGMTHDHIWSNLRDLKASPPRNWSLERRREYFDWAKSVVDELRGTNARLERKFDDIYRLRP